MENNFHEESELAKEIRIETLKKIKDLLNANELKIDDVIDLTNVYSNLMDKEINAQKAYNESPQAKAEATNSALTSLMGQLGALDNKNNSANPFNVGKLDDGLPSDDREIDDLLKRLLNGNNKQ